MNKTFFLAEEMYADGDYKNALDLFRSIENKDDDVLNYIVEIFYMIQSLIWIWYLQIQRVIRSIPPLQFANVWKRIYSTAKITIKMF